MSTAPTTSSSAFSKSSIVPIPAVNGVIINSRGEVLITRRSSKVREPGKWCLPGGHVEIGEQWIPAFRRELQEEVGIEVLAETLIGIYSDPSLTVTAEVLPEGHRGQFVVALFRVDKYLGEIAPNEEVDLWDWFTLDTLPQPMMKSHPVRIQDALRFEHEVFVR